MPTGIYIRTKKYRKILSNAMRKVVRTQEHCQHLSESLRGKKRGPLSNKHKQKLRDALRGKKKSKTHKRNISKGRTGIKFSLSHRQHIRDNARNRTGEKSPRWVHGVPKNRGTLHVRVATLYGKANHCESPTCSGECKIFDWSNKKHDYSSLNRKDWQQLCRSCHVSYDSKFNRRQFN